MNAEYSLFLKKVFTLLLIATILWVLNTISSVVVIVLLSGFLGILMNPLVTFMQKKKVPAWLTVIMIYIVILILIFFVIGTLVPLVIEYISIGISGFIKWIQNIQLIYTTEGLAGFHLPTFIESWLSSLLGGNALDGVLNLIQANIKDIQVFLTEQAKNITTGTFNIGSSVINFISTFIFVGITTFLLVLDRVAVGNFVLDILPENVAKYCQTKFREIEEILGSWIRGQLILGFSIYITTLIGLTLVEWFMGITFEKKGTIALIAGIMEFVPYLGPIISAIPALVVALSISWEVALVTLALYIGIQQLENNVFVPIIMSKSLDLSPFYIFVIMIAGGILAGILGIILAVPVAAILQKLVNDYIAYKKRNAPEPTVPVIKTETLKKPKPRST